MRGPRYCFEVTDSPSGTKMFAYFDTPDRLARQLFEMEKVDVSVEGEYSQPGDPYRIVLCRVPPELRETFLTLVDMLPAVMAYVGNTDYEAFCRSVMDDAWRLIREKREQAEVWRM